MTSAIAKRVSARAALVSFVSALFLSTLSPASAANYTIAYDANAGRVGSVLQAGVTTGSVPTTTSVAQGTVVTVAAQGNLARQGFTLAVGMIVLTALELHTQLDQERLRWAQET